MACRASRPTNGSSETPCGRFTSARISRNCCWPIRMSPRRLPRAVIDGAFDLQTQLKHVDTIFDRVFAGRPSHEAAVPA